MLTPGELEKMASPIPESTGLQPGTVVDGEYKVIGGLAVTDLTVVCRVTQLSTGDVQALKIARSNQPVAQTMTEWEAVHLEALSDAPNVLNMVSRGVNALRSGERLPYVTLELARHDFTEVAPPTNQTEAEGIWSDLMGVARGIDQIHANGLIHGDIKRSNALVVHNNTGRNIRVSDLGTALPVDITSDAISAQNEAERPHYPRSSGDSATIPAGFPEDAVTLGNFGPERFSDNTRERRKYNRATKEGDIFGFGVLAFETLTGKSPWQEKLTEENARSIIKKGPLGRGAFAKWIPQSYIDMIYRCLEPDPKERPTAEELVLFGSFFETYPNSFEPAQFEK
jgi:serine/threonine protein kinase